MAPEPVKLPSSLGERVETLEAHVFGTPENGYRDGLKADFGRLRLIVHAWGGAIVAALLASGLMDGRAAKVLGAFVAGLGG